MPVRRGHVAPQNSYIETIIRKFDELSKLLTFYLSPSLPLSLVYFFLWSLRVISSRVISNDQARECASVCNELQVAKGAAAAGSSPPLVFSCAKHTSSHPLLSLDVFSLSTSSHYRTVPYRCSLLSISLPPRKGGKGRDERAFIPLTHESRSFVSSPSVLVV